MTPRPITRHQHTAPKTYLRGFADADLRVTVRRRAGTELDLHIADVTVRSGFYNVRNSAGVLHDEVERWFASEIENPTAPILERLRQGGPGAVLDDDAAVMADFVAAQLYRTATVRSYMDQVDGHIGPMLLLQEFGKAHGRAFEDVSPSGRYWATAAQALDDIRNPDETRASQLRTTLRQIDSTMTRLRAFRWAVIDASEPCLITGDSPAIGLQPRIGAFAGVLPAGSPVYLPLTPTRLLTGREIPGGSGDRSRLPQWLARAVNFRIACESDDVVIKSPGQAWPPHARVGPARPRLPRPTITRTRRTVSQSSTAPRNFPDVSSPAIRELLHVLEASDLAP